MDLKLIEERKMLYGNNFPDIANLWSTFLGINISPSMVAHMMALMKATRMVNSPEHKDSFDDHECYMWIALNYSDYVRLGQPVPINPMEQIHVIR